MLQLPGLIGCDKHPDGFNYYTLANRPTDERLLSWRVRHLLTSRWRHDIYDRSACLQGGDGINGGLFSRHYETSPFLSNLIGDWASIHNVTRFMTYLVLRHDTRFVISRDWRGVRFHNKLALTTWWYCIALFLSGYAWCSSAVSDKVVKLSVMKPAVTRHWSVAQYYRCRVLTAVIVQRCSKQCSCTFTPNRMKSSLNST